MYMCNSTWGYLWVSIGLSAAKVMTDYVTFCCRVTLAGAGRVGTRQKYIMLSLPAISFLHSTCGSL